MAFLTRREQTLVAFVLGAFLVGFGTKQVRDTRSLAPIINTEAGTR